MKQNGFVLAEFVIALPLLILLLFALGEMTYKIFSTMRTQAADYVLETEAQEVLEQIAADAKTAYSAEIKQAIGGKDIQEIFFNYHVVGNNLGKDFFKNNFNSSIADIVDLIYTRRYTVGATEKGGYHVYAERMKNGPKVNPINGGNFFGDTTITKLKFTSPRDKLLHIELEIQSVVTDKKIKVATSIFMPACEEIR